MQFILVSFSLLRCCMDYTEFSLVHCLCYWSIGYCYYVCARQVECPYQLDTLTVSARQH